MITEVEGVILSITPYGETSKIINVFTTEYGLIGIMCKGAMGMKSRLRSVTDKLTYGIFNIYYKKDKLSTLVSVDVINSFKKIKNDILLISYTSYISELISQVIKQTNDKRVYDDYINSTYKIKEMLNKPILSEEQIQEINSSLSSYNHDEVNITHYKQGQILITQGIINKIDINFVKFL